MIYSLNKLTNLLSVSGNMQIAKKVEIIQMLINTLFTFAAAFTQQTSQTSLVSETPQWSLIPKKRYEWNFRSFLEQTPTGVQPMHSNSFLCIKHLSPESWVMINMLLLLLLLLESRVTSGWARFPIREFWGQLDQCKKLQALIPSRKIISGQLSFLDS